MIRLTEHILHPLEVHGELLVYLSGPDDTATDGGQVTCLAALAGGTVGVLHLELVVESVYIVLGCFCELYSTDLALGYWVSEY